MWQLQLKAVHLEEKRMKHPNPTCLLLSLSDRLAFFTLYNAHMLQCRSRSSTAEPGADSDARAKSETTGVAPVLPSDVRDQGASPAGPVETPAAPGSTSRVDTAVRPGEEHPAEGASSQGAANEGPELQYDSPWEAASSLQDETAQASKQALPTVPSKPAGLDEEQKAAASNQELPQIVVSQGADSAAAGTLEEDVKVESDRQTHSGNPSLPEALQGEEQQEGNREAAVDASIALEGPMSPVSPFAAEDTGHLTGMLDESDANRSALKGAAAAVALARRRSHGDLPDITNGKACRYPWHPVLPSWTVLCLGKCALCC